MKKQHVFTVGQLVEALKAFPAGTQVLGEGEENWFYNFVAAEEESIKQGRRSADGDRVVVLRKW